MNENGTDTFFVETVLFVDNFIGNISCQRSVKWETEISLNGALVRREYVPRHTQIFHTMIAIKCECGLSAHALRDVQYKICICTSIVRCSMRAVRAPHHEFLCRTVSTSLF